MGLHKHSTDNNYFIFCVGQDPRHMNAFLASMAGQNVSVKSLIGSYEGTVEYSFISNMENYHIISPWLKDEESILHIHNYDSRDVPDATLRFLAEGRKVELGKMRNVPKDVALARPSWTYDPVYEKYFITDQ